MRQIQFRKMNTDIQLLAWGDQKGIADGFEQVQQFMDASEKRFSRFLPDSELSAMNASCGKPFYASHDMFRVMHLAQRYFHLTRGLFDPSILPDLRRAGYSVSFEEIGNLREMPLLDEIMLDERPSFSEIDFDEKQGTLTLPCGMAVDLGGIAKGWIAEQSALLLAGYAQSCAVNAGGDMFLVGNPEGREKWPVSIENPLQLDTDITTLQVDPGAVVTSSVTRRNWKQGGIQRHHLIDPRTREPADTDWLSVTVLSQHAHEAEVFAKALLICDPSERENLVSSDGSPINYIAIDRDLMIWSNRSVPEYANVH